MLDEHTTAGACRDPSELEKEIEIALDALKKKFELSGYELPVTVIHVLLSRVKRDIGFADYVLMLEELSDQFSMLAGGIRTLLDRDEAARIAQDKADLHGMH